MTGSRRRFSANAGGTLCIATIRNESPSLNSSVPNLASQSRVAFSNMAWNTGSSSPGELEMIPSTSDVAVCCSSDSLGEARHQRDLLVGERANLLTVEIDGSDQLISFEHWDRDHRPIASQFGSGDDGWNALNVWPGSGLMTGSRLRASTYAGGAL